MTSRATPDIGFAGLRGVTGAKEVPIVDADRVEFGDLTVDPAKLNQRPAPSFTTLTVKLIRGH